MYIHVNKCLFVPGLDGAKQISQNGVDFVTLHEVSVQEQFEEYYKSNNLQTIEEKINYLKKAMKVRAIVYDEFETQQEVLAGLEESALLGYWKASW